MTYRQLLNNFTVSPTIDRTLSGEIDTIHYFQNAVRANEYAVVGTSTAYLYFSIRSGKLDLSLISPAPEALDDFLTGIGKMSWKKYFIKDPPAMHAHHGFTQTFTGYDKAVSEFYTLVVKQIKKSTPNRNLIKFVDRINPLPLPVPGMRKYKIIRRH